MYFTVPARYKNYYIFCIVLFSQLGFDFSRSQFRAKLRESEFTDAYERKKNEFDDSNPTRIAELHEVKFVVWKEKKIVEYGTGKPIYLKIKATSRLYLRCTHFYYLPEGLLKNNNLITTLDEILLLRPNPKRAKFDSNFHSCALKDIDIEEIEKLHNLCINIHTKTRTESSTQYKYAKLRYGREATNSTVVDLFKQKETSELILIRDMNKFMQNIFYCKNAEEGCRLVFCRKSVLESHLKICKTVEEINQNPNIIQREFTNFDILIEKAIRHKIIHAFPQNENFIFFDVECTLRNSNKSTEKTIVLSTHRLVSIAANSFINGKHESKVWTINDDSEDSQIALVDNFYEFCINAKNQVSIDEDVINALDILREMQKYLRIENFYKEEVSELISILSPFTYLPVFGYNNVKYDNKVIIEYLLQALDRKNILAKDIRLLKKASRYFSVQFCGLCIKDLLNFSIPASLDRYLKTWTKTESKLIYPYEYFSSIEEIRSCIDFPTTDAFYSRLKGPVDIDLYNHCKSIYQMHRNLNPKDKEYWSNFEDYLKFYNLSDVVPASKALIIQFKTYKANFNLSPMQYLGLPGFARCAMLKMFDRKCSSIFSFPSCSTATSVFRTQIIGGLCNVLHRHLTTIAEPNAAYAATHNTNGKKWDQIKFYDVNAMYPSTFKKRFPCGRGFEWNLNGSILHKKLMTSEKISISSIEWLDFMQHSDNRLKLDNGDYARIISGWGSKEHKIGHYQIDGYAKVGNMHYFYEFNGCFFHNCEHCKIKNIAKDEEARLNFLKSIPNSELIVMTECKWNEMKKQITWKSSISMHLCKHSIDQNIMIENFSRNELYGFAVVDIEATEKAKKFLDINWPPILFKAEITIDDLPKWMQANVTDKSFPRTTIVQGMFKNEILLHTELIYFYVQHGFQVTKVHKFFEFEGQCCFQKVHDVVYQARVDATLEDDSMKATAVKLVSNSMYGQMLMVIKLHLKK